MINRENLIKIGRAGGNTSNRETPDQIGRVGMSAVAYPLGVHILTFRAEKRNEHAWTF